MPDLTVPNRDLSLLHPTFRASLAAVLAECAAAGLPFAVFEGYRCPARQQWLWGQGRSREGRRVTNALPWDSYHQYGLAADVVLSPFGPGSWRAGPEWARLHEIGHAHRLEPLSIEQPHLQLAGLRLVDLRSGRLPVGGDESWTRNLSAAAAAPGLGLIAVAQALDLVREE